MSRENKIAWRNVSRKVTKFLWGLETIPQARPGPRDTRTAVTSATGVVWLVLKRRCHEHDGQAP